MHESPGSEQAGDRLLQAAVEMFAERGFRDTTVREICAKADANVAAVNYYFRSKEALYAAALAFALRQAEARYPLDALVDPALTAEERLRTFIVTFTHRLLDDSRLGFHGKFIAREIVDPTPALDQVFETIMRPKLAQLEELMPDIVGSGWSRADLCRCVLSIVGQCLVYRHSRSIIERMCPEIIADAEEIKRTAEHIARFSLAALKQLAEDRKQGLNG
jgi:AcrR family transcriptional regulator